MQNHANFPYIMSEPNESVTKVFSSEVLSFTLAFTVFLQIASIILLLEIHVQFFALYKLLKVSYIIPAKVLPHEIAQH